MEFLSYIMYHYFRQFYNVMTSDEKTRAMSASDTLVDIATTRSHAIYNKTHRPQVAMITCKPDEDPLPAFCVKLSNPHYPNGVALITCYTPKPMRQKRLRWRWKRRKKSE